MKIVECNSIVVTVKTATLTKMQLQLEFVRLWDFPSNLSNCSLLESITQGKAGLR